MANHYNDVDRLILDRWEDVVGLLRAYEELQERIGGVLEEVGVRLQKWAGEEGYRLDQDARVPEYWAWKASWEKRRGDILIYVTLGGFTPQGYRKTKEQHPYLWVNTSGLESLRLKEEERVEFGRELRRLLGDRAKEWEHEWTTDGEEPLGAYATEVTERDRVDFVANPDKLYNFATTSFRRLFTLSDVIDQTLTKFRG